jgi:hypothetical protein
MKNRTLNYAIAAALASSLALAGCKKEEAAPAPAPAPVEIAPAPTPAPAAAATVSVVFVDVGSVLAPDGKVATPASEFAANDVITASVTTNVSEPGASVPGTLSVRWLYDTSQEVNTESRDLNFSGPGVTNFQISKPDGWPVGNYRLEVSLDGNVVQTRELIVK